MSVCSTLDSRFAAGLPTPDVFHRVETSTRCPFFDLSYNADSDGGDSRNAHKVEFHAWLKMKYAKDSKTESCIL